MVDLRKALEEAGRCPERPPPSLEISTGDPGWVEWRRHLGAQIGKAFVEQGALGESLCKVGYLMLWLRKFHDQKT